MYLKLTKIVLISVMKIDWMQTPTALPTIKPAETPIIQIPWWKYVRFVRPFLPNTLLKLRPSFTK